MRKRWKQGLLVTMGAALLVTGCGTGKKTNLDAKNPITIHVWNYYSGAQLESFNNLVQEFNVSRGKELGIVVESASEGGIVELRESVLAAANKEVGAGDLPNIFASYTDAVCQIDEMGLVEDVSDYFTEDEKNEYIDSYIQEGDLDGSGSIKIFPVAKATEIFMINQTDWDKFAKETGVKMSELETIEGVTRIAEKYYDWTDAKTDTPDDGKAFFGRDALANYVIIGAKQLGIDILSVDKDGNIVLDLQEDVMRKIWDNYYVPFINGYFSAVGKFRSDDVKTGNAVCFVGSSSSASFFPSEVIISDSEKYPIEVGVMKAPIFENADRYAIQQGAGMAVVKASEAKVEASVEFLKWFTEADNNIRFSIASGYLPVKKEANDISKIEQIEEVQHNVSETLKVSLDTVNTSTMYTIQGKNDGVRTILGDALSNKAAADKEQVMQAMANGMSRADAVAQFDTDENFSEWYQELKAELEKSIQN